MNEQLVILAVMAGAANWAFRALPTMLMRHEAHPGGMMARFLASTGPAAIATLFVASVLPQIWPAPKDLIALIAGTAATVLAFLPRRSVVVATLSGAIAYGAAFWMMG